MKANRSIACLLLAALPTLASAHAAEKVETLRDQALAEIPGHRGLMLTVSFKPGQVSAPHVHPGSVFVYEGVRFKVLAANARRVIRVSAELIEIESNDDDE